MCVSIEQTQKSEPGAELVLRSRKGSEHETGTRLEEVRRAGRKKKGKTQTPECGDGQDGEKTRARVRIAK